MSDLSDEIASLQKHCDEMVGEVSLLSSEKGKKRIW